VSGRTPSLDLVVATVDRTDELGAFLDSVERQHHPAVRVLLVDQNGDDRLADVLGGRDPEILRLRSERGLSRARNAALPELRADLVGFPDDDCVYPPGLLDRAAERFAGDPDLDGLTGRSEDASGRSSGSWKRDAATLTDDNLWNRAISFTIFLRRPLVEGVGPFDERLGLGSDEPWSSGEEIDYLVRAVRAGARVEYDPDLVVLHRIGPDDAPTRLRDGASVGYLLRKHGYPKAVVARMLLRPLVGAPAALLHGDATLAGLRLATFRGRLRAYRGTRRSNSSV
jgi:GT2 family glycosyltransferase